MMMPVHFQAAIRTVVVHTYSSYFYSLIKNNWEGKSELFINAKYLLMQEILQHRILFK